jgi:hypothetical protein
VNGKDIPDYYSHMKASVRVIQRNAKGIDIARYVESGADHYFHAENYCLVASRVTAPGQPLAQGATKGW